MKRTLNRKDELRARIDHILHSRQIDAEFLSSKSMDQILEEISIYHQELEYQNMELSRIRSELEISQRHYYDLFNEAPIGYVLFNRDYSIVAANKAFSRLVDMETPLHSFPQIIHPESQDIFYFHVRNLLKQGTVESVQLVLRGNSKDIPVRIESNLQVESDKLLIRSAVLDMSQEKEVENALLSAKNQAEEGSRLKSQFIANMSHEIRTPMNGIMGFAQLLTMTRVDGEQEEFLKNILISADILLAAIDGILDISKIEAGKIQMEEIPYSLASVVEDSVIPFKAKALEKGIGLSIKLSSEIPPLLLGDPTRLRQILTNLVNNAVKFTHKGQVQMLVDVVTSSVEHVQLSFTVKDTGIGISAAALGLIFEPFMQGDISSTRNYGGTGLGLTICKRLVEAMGGEIHVNSEETHGSTFVVTLSQKRA